MLGFIAPCGPFRVELEMGMSDAGGLRGVRREHVEFSVLL